MPRRTAEANKAVLAAWKNEQELVSKGKGTRDWTPEQQKDIMERGKAYDDEGRAFEGQHMKSVEKYPEYQGDPKNIQFLTKKEHLEAHKGSWQNPTNWYYDPLAKRYFDFDESAPALVRQSHYVNLLWSQRNQRSHQMVRPQNHLYKKKTKTIVLLLLQCGYTLCHQSMRHLLYQILKIPVALGVLRINLRQLRKRLGTLSAKPQNMQLSVRSRPYYLSEL